MHPFREKVRRSTAALERNLAYLGFGRIPARLPPGRRGAGYRLRKDHPVLPDGGANRQYSRHHAFGRPHVQWMAR